MFSTQCGLHTPPLCASRRAESSPRVLSPCDEDAWGWKQERDAHAAFLCQGACRQPTRERAQDAPVRQGGRRAGRSLTVGPPLCFRALGVSVTDYTFEDCQLALAEGQLRLPADTCLLEFARLVRSLG